MEHPEIQTAIAEGMLKEMRRLEIIVFGQEMGGWPKTGLSLQGLRDLAKRKQLCNVDGAGI